MKLGRTKWAIAEGFIPPDDPGKSRALISHEAACLLNTNDSDALVTLTIYFSDREPAGPYSIQVPARRTLHLRFNDLNDPEPIGAGIDYSSVFESDIPIVVQHTRLDSRWDSNALLSTIAYGES
jgi:hypothetical protein